MTYKLTSTLLALATIIIVSNIALVAKADAWDKKTIVTFSGPVGVPGKNLPAGTYVFKLADSNADRNIVEVFTKDQEHLLTSFIAVPKVRLSQENTTIISVNEETTGAPEVIDWFYPGDTRGLGFVYAK